MSENSAWRILQTAPMVRALRRAPSRDRARSAADSIAWPPLTVISALQVAHAVLAHLDLIAIGEDLGLDPLAVDVGAVQRAEVVDVEAVPAAHEQGVVAGDGDVVEEDAGVGAAPDREALAGDRERLAGSPAAGADHQSG